MPSQSTAMNLTGHCLIAMPDMPDFRFRNTVIYLCAHSEEGAMGLIVNQIVDDLKLGDLLEQVSIEPGELDGGAPLMFGGPVETGRGFVLHSPDFHSGLSTKKITETVALTSTMDILEEASAGNGPAKALIALGYAGWGAGQLEQELAANGWLTGEIGPEVIFDVPVPQKWARALQAMGVDPAILSGSGGRA